MNVLVASLIRTYVPLAVGAFAAWLITIGVELDSDTEAALVVALSGILSAVYYTVARLIERRWPSASILLGSSTQPDAYTRGEPEH